MLKRAFALGVAGGLLFGLGLFNGRIAERNQWELVTFLAEHSQVHLVQPGETLESIAAQHHPERAADYVVKRIGMVNMWEEPPEELKPSTIVFVPTELEP